MSCEGQTFTIKRRDTSPALQYRLEPTVNLAGATVRFNMRGMAGALVIERQPAVIVGDPQDGVVRWDWREGDTAASGAYEAEFEVTYADGTVETWPNAGFIDVRIGEDLA